MDSITFSLLTSTINPLYSGKPFATIPAITTAATVAAITTTTVNGTVSAADLTKTLIPAQYQVILLSFAYGIISLLAVIGNSCIIYIVIRNRRMHSVTNYFICNLALSDCLVACFAVPFQFQAAVLQRWVLPHFLCKLAPFVQVLSVDVSIYTLVAVSLDRYHVMLHPLKPKLSTKSAFAIFIMIWLIALGSSTPRLLFFDVYFIDDFGYRCLPNSQEELSNNNSTAKSYDIHKIYIVYNIYSQYIIPFIIISCAYFRIASHLYFSKPVGQTKHQEVIARNKRKVLKMLFLVVALFLICWFPLQLYNFLNVYKPEINDFEHIVVVWLCANWLAMSNSCHNPFIYGLCSAKFNREFRKLFSCLPCIDASQLDSDRPTKSRPPVPSSARSKAITPTAVATTTTTTTESGAPFRRTNCQHHTSNSSPVSSQGPKRSHQSISKTTDSQVISTTTAMPTTKRYRDGRPYLCLSSSDSDRHHHHRNPFFNNNNNYYSSKIDRSITNCEKFLLDQDLIHSTKGNDLLLIHARQSARFV